MKAFMSKRLGYYFPFVLRRPYICFFSGGCCMRSDGGVFVLNRERPLWAGLSGRG